MKKMLLISTIAVLGILGSCDMIPIDLVPDIDQVISLSYDVTIDENVSEGGSDTSLIDIAENKEFQNYSQYITEYRLRKITLEVSAYDAPEDLFFSGAMIAYDTAFSAGTEVARIDSLSLFDLYSSGVKVEMEEDTVATEQILAWLEDPGSFNVSFLFGFESDTGTAYDFKPEDIGSTFRFKVNYHLTFVTGDL